MMPSNRFFGSGFKGATLSPRLLLSLLAGILLLLMTFAGAAAAALELPQKTCCPQPAGNGEYWDPTKYSDLGWQGGEGATEFQVYFGTSNPPPFWGTTVDTYFTPGIVGDGTTYYWRIDATNEAGTTTGDLWHLLAIGIEEEHFNAFYEQGEETIRGHVVDSQGKTYSFNMSGEDYIVYDWQGQHFDQYGWVTHIWFDMPHGPASVTWEPVPGYELPDPPSQTWVVADYPAPYELKVTYLRTRGSVNVTVSPESAAWIYFRNGQSPPFFEDEFLHDWAFLDEGYEQVGSQFFPSEVTLPGNVFWRDLANYDPPEPRVQPFDVLEGQTTQVVGIYTRHAGSVEVAVTPDTAPWSFTDGDGGVHSGTGDALVADVPTGDIVLQWGALAGYDPPEPVSVTQALAKEAAITFTGEYTPIVVPPELLFTGFLPPIGGADALGGSFAHPLRIFKRGSTIPVKFALADADGPVTTGIHTLEAVKYLSATDPLPPVKPLSTDKATTGNRFRFADGLWHFNISTKSRFTPGTWQLIATLSDGTQHSAWIALR